MLAANSSAHTTTSAITTQKDSKDPTTTSVSELRAAIRISADVRRLKSPRIRGAASPPRICAPATIAADRPATT